MDQVEVHVEAFAPAQFQPQLVLPTVAAGGPAPARFDRAEHGDQAFIDAVPLADLLNHRLLAHPRVL